jgi:hypothetical protein
MVDAILYYRTGIYIKGSSASDPYFDPVDLPTSYKVPFNFPDNLLEGIDYQYQNNVLDIPVPNSLGIRKINKQDNGLKTVQLTLNGEFLIPKTAGVKTVDADILKLKLMASMLQVEDKHPYGKIGFYSPNAPEFSLDPNATSSLNATKGYTLTSLRIGYIGQKTTRYGFSVTLAFGGTV